MAMKIYEVANMTTKLLYENKKEVYENLDKVEKQVIRICGKLEQDKILQFNTDMYDKDCRAKFFATWIKILEDNVIGGSNRELLNNICKLEWSVNIDDAFAIFISEKYIEKPKDIHDMILKCTRINAFIEHCKNRLRKEIRHGGKNILFRYKQARNLMDEFLEGYNEKELFDWIQLLKITEELFSDLLMQILIYGIANNQEIIVEKKEETLKQVKTQISSLKIEVNTVNSYGIFGDFAVKLCYLNRRKELMTEVAVVNELIKQNRENNYVKYPLDEFQCNGKIIKIIESKEKDIKSLLQRYVYYIYGQVNDYSDYTLDDCQFELEKILSFSEKRNIESVKDIKELKDIITEGDTKEKTVRFKEKLEASWGYCDFIQEYAGREILPFYLQHIKVIYREIIVDKIKFNNRTTHIIMKDLIEKIEKNVQNGKYISHDQESYFLLEKVSRGLHREKGNIDMYNYMGDIRIAYYQKILEIYQFMDVKDALSCLKKLIEYIDETMREALSKI